MKKVLFVLLGMFFLLPMSNALANDYTDGYFDNYINGVDYNAPKEWVDNDLTTGIKINSGSLKRTITFTQITDFKGYYFYQDSPVQVNYEFKDSSGKRIDMFSLIPGQNGGIYENKVIQKVKTIDIYTSGSVGRMVLEMELFENKIIVAPITNLKESHKHDTALISWTNPGIEEFDGVIIKRNGVEIDDLPKSSTSYQINNLKPETTYNFEVIAKYTNGAKAESQSISLTTDVVPVEPPPSPEIRSLKVEVTHERVDLSWRLPLIEDFKHVNIYRDTIKETALIDKLLGTQMVYAAETKIFETNGTYFNDLTVSPSTTYEYTLTTTSTELVESEGISKQVTTSAKPKPSIGGGGYEEDEQTGDFTYTWTSPTKGKVKVMVGGVLFKTVNASDLKIVIPKATMKFTLLGAPDVKLIPVDENGTEGNPSTLPPVGGIGGGGIPFTPNDLLGAGMGLMWVIGPFVLLALAFLLVPKLREMIVQAFKQRKGQPMTTGRRFNS